MDTTKLEKELKKAKEELGILKKINANVDEIEFVENEIKELEEKLKNAQKNNEEKSNLEKPVKDKPLRKRGRKKLEKNDKKKVLRKRGRKKLEENDKKKVLRKRGRKKIEENDKKKVLRKRGRKKIEEKQKEKEKEKENKTNVSKEKEKSNSNIKSKTRAERGKYEKEDNEIKKLPSLKYKKRKELSVEYNGKTYFESDPEFCDILIKQLEERMNKRKASKPKRISISSKVGDNIASSVVTAIRGAFKDKKEDILENKRTANNFLKTIEKIEIAAQKFISEMKSILQDNFKQRDFDKEFKEVEELIKKIKETIKKNFEKENK